MPYWRLFYHIVFGTRDGEPLISGAWEQDLHNMIAGKGQGLEAFVYAVGGTENHVHVVVSVPPKVALATFIGRIKGSSSHFVNHSLTSAGLFAWQKEYGVLSLEGTALPDIVQYVKNQRRHHGDGTVMTALERMETEGRDLVAADDGREAGTSSRCHLGGE